MAHSSFSWDAKARRRLRLDCSSFVPIPLELVGWSVCAGCISNPNSKDYFYLSNENKTKQFLQLANELIIANRFASLLVVDSHYFREFLHNHVMLLVQNLI